MKRRFILEVEVDEDDILRLYPNYRFNYSSADQFIESCLPQPRKDTEDMPSDNDLKRWGFEKRIIGEVIKGKNKKFEFKYYK